MLSEQAIKSGMDKFFQNLQPIVFLNRFIDVSAIKTMRRGELVLEDFIKRIIKAAIESFPINERKKTELLQSLLDKKGERGGTASHVLR